MNAIEFRGITKKFDRLIANDQVSFVVKKGTIHGLIGENGAGKSTLMKILFGLYGPDSGEILIQGKSSKIRKPSDAIRLGIGMVHQHFMLAESLTALQNITLGFEKTNGFGLREDQAKQEIEKIAQEYRVRFHKWDALISELSVGERQKVEILKLLYQQSEVLILDEPSAVLTPSEVIELFDQLQFLKSLGKTIILITHKLKEILNYTDYFTVMRRGRVEWTDSSEGKSESDLAKAMVGREISFRYEGERRIASKVVGGKPRMEFESLTVAGSPGLRSLNLKLFPGEILGLAGVQGNGQSEFVRVLKDPKRYADQSSGRLELEGVSLWRYGPSECRQMGLSVIPEDRLSEALVLEQDMVENFFLGAQSDPLYRTGLGWGPFSNFWVHRSVLRTRVEKAIQDYDIRPPYPTVWLKKMSGGNQQKFVIARALDSSPRVILVSHPTRGVDVGAIERIHEEMMKQRNQGASILLLSTELEELMDLCDRIAIFYEGSIVKVFSRSEFQAHEMGRFMAGGGKDS